MKKKESDDKVVNDEICIIIEDIKKIENQIRSFKVAEFKIFRKYKNYLCDDRIKKLEDVKNFLLKRLEYKMDNNKNYHE